MALILESEVLTNMHIQEKRTRMLAYAGEVHACICRRSARACLCACLTGQTINIQRKGVDRVETGLSGEGIETVAEGECKASLPLNLRGLTGLARTRHISSALQSLIGDTVQVIVHKVR